MKKNIADVIRDAGHAPIPCFSGTYNVQAAVQEAMNGKTHFFDDSALAFFSCRVLKAYRLDEGAILATICRQAEGFHGGRVYVVNFHDFTGHSLSASLEERSFKSLDAARRHLWSEAEKMDAPAIVAAAIRREREALERMVRQHAQAMRKNRAFFDRHK